MQIFLVAFSWFFTFFINFFPSRTTISHGVLVAFGQSNVMILAITIALALVNCGVYQLRQIYGYTILQERNVESASSSDEPFGRRFSFTQILLATQHFNESLVIGKGGFGKVYKGIIHGRPEVLAIKRLNPDSKQGAREFWREIDTLSKLRHVHLVSLLGYCMERDEMIIVYEYMPRGTIADNLYKFGRDGKERIPLTWEQRLKICIGVARGLDYLHTGFQHGIIHRDVKDTNILLDENLVAKISDFGLSKLGETHDEVSTKVKGTIGYMDPDYIMTHKPSTKSDVYAFGIVLLVVLSGRPATERRFFKEPKCLLDCYRKCLTKGETNKIIDPCIHGEILTKSLTCFMETVEKCLHRRPKKRPSMAQLVVHLESALEEQIGANAIPSTLSDDTVVAHSFSDRSKEQFEFYEFQFTPITKESIGSLPDERNNTSKDIHEADQHHTQMMKEHDRRIQEVDHHHTQMFKEHDLRIRGRSNKKDANSEEFVSNPKHKDLTCNYCKNIGHIKSDCIRLKNKEKRKKESGKESAQASFVQDESDGDIFFADDKLMPVDEWILDFGCKYHMCPNRDWFSRYDSVRGGVVSLGNGVVCKVDGIGMVRIKTYDGVVRTLKKVRHVPDLKKNLISLGALETLGFRYTAEGGVLKVIKGVLVVMKACRSGDLYVLKGSTVIGNSAIPMSSRSRLDITKRRPFVKFKQCLDLFDTVGRL